MNTMKKLLKFINTYFQGIAIKSISATFCANYSGDEWNAFLTLNQANNSTIFCFMHLPHHFVMSISPERFIHLSDHKIETRPIKGTPSP